MSNLSDFLNKKLSDPILTLDGTEGMAGQVPISQGAGAPPIWGAVAGVIADYQEFTTSGTWTKPAGAKWVYVELVGGGGGGQNVTTQGNVFGGGGGGYNDVMLRSSEVDEVESVIVGAGGLGGEPGALSNGVDGGASSFGLHVSARGGKAGATGGGGAGGGGEAAATSGAEAQGGFSSGGAGYGSRRGGNCIKGGAGGSGGANNVNINLGGVSASGGNGGSGGPVTDASKHGQFPGGGGGGVHNNSGGGNGGSGVVRVWCW